MAAETESPPDISGRIKRIAILFIGIGLYALVGVVLRELRLLENSTVTYLVVGLIIGAIGVLLVVTVTFGFSEADPN